MTIILSSYRLESETNTHDTDTNSTDSVHNLSNDSSVETTEENTTTSIEIEELRNFDSQSATTIQFVDFENLEIKINDLLVSELNTQSKIDDLIVLQKYNNTIMFNIFIGLAFLVLMTVMYKVITFSFYE